MTREEYEKTSKEYHDQETFGYPLIDDHIGMIRYIGEDKAIIQHVRDDNAINIDGRFEELPF